MDELRLKKLDAPLAQVPCNIESPTPGVVLVEVDLGRYPAPLHWRVGLWDKLPLDLSMDPSGRLLSVQFVLQDERVGRDDGAIERAVSNAGRPVFDVASWPENRYVDVEAPVVAARTPAGTLVLRVGDGGEVERVLLVGDGLALGLRRTRLVDIMIGPLSREEWEAIDAFSFVPGES